MTLFLRSAAGFLIVLGFAGFAVANPPAGGGHEHAAAAPVAEKPKKGADSHAAPAAPAADSAHGAPAPAGAAAGHGAPGVAPADAMKFLIDGNERFTTNTRKRPNQDQARLCDTFANGQHPFAAILSCADSRVPPELVFDTGIGDLFVVRVAGNVADIDEIGTLEYGVEHLGINAIVVMGHQKCGAVTAVIDKAQVTPNIAKLVDNIVPAAEKARQTFPQLAGPRLVEKAIRMNVYQSISDLTAKSDLLRERVKSGKLKITGAVYNLHTGEVDWLEPATGVAEGKPAVEAHGTAPAAKSVELLHEPEKAIEHDAHGPKAEAIPAEPGAPTDATEPTKDNFLALGGLMGGGAVVSLGILHFMRSR